jgi:tRNA dimethylallyltransferase
VKVDAEAAIKIHPNDLRRTVRALEVYYLRDKKLSDFQREHAFQERSHVFHLIFLVRARTELYPRIEKRVDRMLDEGLEAEVRSLMDRGYSPHLPAMQGLGYKQFTDCFSGKTSRDEAVTLLKRDTKRYAKRQFTWFRREADAVWIDITGLAEPADIVERIKKNIEISKKLV